MADRYTYQWKQNGDGRNIGLMNENKWTPKTTEWKPWNQKRSRGKPMTR